MTLQEVEEILYEMQDTKDPVLQKLNQEWLRLAVRYARLRTDWQLADRERRGELEQERSTAHEAFISQCAIVARSVSRMGGSIEWYSRLNGDRRAIGDLACLIHAILGLRAR